jgi:hypothetical protein
VSFSRAKDLPEAMMLIMVPTFDASDQAVRGVTVSERHHRESGTWPLAEWPV